MSSADLNRPNIVVPSTREGSPYGETFADRFDGTASLALQSHFAHGEIFAITRVTTTEAMTEPAAPFPAEPSFFISLPLCRIPLKAYEYWLDGKYREVPELPPYVTNITDMELSPVPFVRTAADYLHFYITRAALRVVALDLGMPPVHHLRTCMAEIDPVFAQIAHIVVDAPPLTAMESDWFGLIVAAHLLKNYAGSSVISIRRRSGLALWQKRAAVEFLRANLHRDVRLSEAAAICSLSTSHFARAFKISFGRSLTLWMTEARLAHAKDLLNERRNRLIDVAHRCGFHGQAAFTRWFSRQTGSSPGAWRRSSPGVR